jgi:hypothetical protein
VRGVPGPSAQLGGLLAAAAAISVILAALVRAVGGADVEPSEDETTALTPSIPLAGFGRGLCAGHGRTCSAVSRHSDKEGVIASTWMEGFCRCGRRLPISRSSSQPRVYFQRGRLT